MLLAIDTGNTNTVFAVFDDLGHCRGEWRAATNVQRTADEMGIWLLQIFGLAGIDPKSVTAAIIATVVPAMRFPLLTLCRRYFHCEALVVGHANLDVGCKILIDHPEELGADRIVNAVGAFELYGGPRIVADFGTATTFDVIDAEGSYLGGAIAPGINLSIEALHLAAAQLPRVSIGRPDRVIGKNTVGAMRSGVFFGYLGLIEGIIARIRTELGTDAGVVATGGLAPLFADCSDSLNRVDLQLTLKGLWTIYKRNLRP